IGMAVDANVLIFERMKEEIRAGRGLGSAVDIGFNRAWLAIRDSNLTTLIAAAILFFFADRLGASAVQGFALTLAIGVGVSMITALLVTRSFLQVFVHTPLARRLKLFAP
ncbi:MAG: protein translocase subunit SecD, partial [SAR202 cluster bacterium]|nr:protein translocase subunit SecD [SAR202 cluster bacterium]